MISGFSIASNRLKGRICAHSVIVSVAHNHASVKAVVSRFAGRYDLNLRREEILFLYIIFLCKDLHDIGFYLFLDVVFFIRFQPECCR